MTPVNCGEEASATLGERCHSHKAGSLGVKKGWGNQLFCTECGQRLVGAAPKFCAACGAQVATSPDYPGESSSAGVPETPTCRVGPCEAPVVVDSAYCSAHSSIQVVKKGKPRPPKFQGSRPYKGANPHIVCPHCQTQGSVKTWKADQKTGIDGEKAGAAVITGGLSVFATGLSGSRGVTRAKCLKCGVKWDY